MSDHELRSLTASLVAVHGMFASEVVVEFQPDIVSSIEFALGYTLNEHERRIVRETYELERLWLVEQGEQPPKPRLRLV